MSRARQEDLAAQPLPRRIVGFGLMFLGLPYVEGTLDLPGPEQLVVNLEELDCVTLVENALALALVAGEDGGWDDFRATLERIRYRGGRLAGYGSRLHYFTDWIADNERKGLLRDLTRELGGVPADEPISYMTDHRDRYPRLRDDPELVEELRRTEERVNARGWHWIPQESLEEVVPRIRDGDIIGVTTRRRGLDVSHTALALWVDGELHLLHAPRVGRPVEISPRPLVETLRRSPLQNGLVVARAIEPG